MGCIPGKLSLCSTKKAKRKGSAAESAVSDTGSEQSGERRSFKPTEGLRAIIPIIQSASLLAQATISTSQSNFFRWLDEKIEQGKELDSEEEKEEKRQRMDRIVREWENFLETRPTPQQMYNSCHLITPEPPSPSPRSIVKSSSKPALKKTPLIKLDRNFSKDSLDSYSLYSDAGNRLIPQKEDDGNSSDDSAISVKIGKNRKPSGETSVQPIQPSDQTQEKPPSPTDNPQLSRSCPSSTCYADIPKNFQIAKDTPVLVVTSDDAFNDFSNNEMDLSSGNVQLNDSEAETAERQKHFGQMKKEHSFHGRTQFEYSAQQGDAICPNKQNIENGINGDCVTDEKAPLVKSSDIEETSLQTSSPEAVMQTRFSNGSLSKRPEMGPRRYSEKLLNTRMRAEHHRRKSYPPPGGLPRPGRTGMKMNGNAPVNLINNTIVTSNRLVFTAKRSLPVRRCSYGDGVPLRVK